MGGEDVLVQISFPDLRETDRRLSSSLVKLQAQEECAGKRSLEGEGRGVTNDFINGQCRQR